MLKVLLYYQFVTVTSPCPLTESEPQCVSSLLETGGTVLEGDAVNMTCEVRYHGDPGWAPQIQWLGPEGILTDVNSESRVGMVRSSIVKRAVPELDGAIYSAKLHFAPYRGYLPPRFATNPPNYTHKHSFLPITVYCEYFSKSQRYSDMLNNG